MRVASMRASCRPVHDSESSRALRSQALMMAGSFTGPALGGILADALGMRCVRFPSFRQSLAAALPDSCEQMSQADRRVTAVRP